MTRNCGGLLGVALGAGLLMGCAETQKIHARAVAPTAEEAKALTQAQLDQQANDLAGDVNAKGRYRVVGAAHFKTKVMMEGNGGQLYEVTGSEVASRPR